MNIKSILESLEDLENIENISKEALIKDNVNKANKEGKAYISKGGDSFNYNKTLQDVIIFVREKDENLAKAIEDELPKIKERYRIRRNNNYEIIKQNYKDEKINTYKYKK